MSTHVLRLPDVLRRTGLSRSQIYALVARGEFAPLIKLSVRASGFEEAAVESWLRERIERSQKNSAGRGSSPGEESQSEKAP